MNLLIDDAKEGLSYDLVARNGQTGLAVLESLPGDISALYIDFDLGAPSKLDGLQVLKFAWKHNCLPHRIIIVSLNPVGRKAITAFLKFDARYKQINNSVFVKEVA